MTHFYLNGKLKNNTRLPLQGFPASKPKSSSLSRLCSPWVYLRTDLPLWLNFVTQNAHLGYTGPCLKIHNLLMPHRYWPGQIWPPLFETRVDTLPVSVSTHMLVSSKRGHRIRGIISPKTLERLRAPEPNQGITNPVKVFSIQNWHSGAHRPASVITLCDIDSFVHSGRVQHCHSIFSIHYYCKWIPQPQKLNISFLFRSADISVQFCVLQHGLTCINTYMCTALFVILG